MKKSWSAPLLAAILAIALVGCGDSGESGGKGAKSESGASGESDGSGSGGGSAADRAEREAAKMVPPAMRFGVERFKVVYELKGQQNGTRTLWVEGYGARVGLEEEVTIYGAKQHKLYYWDGERGHLKDLPDGKVFSSRLRMKASEPTSFATSTAKNLEMAGYVRAGEKTVLGRTCEHWKNEKFNFEGCRWNGVRLEFQNGAGTDEILQTTVAVELVEGEPIPDRIKALGES